MMPKVIIKKNDLPPISADDEGYNLRIRLVSQDRNRISFWTPLYTVNAPGVTEIPCIVEVVNTGSGKIVNLVWEDPNNNKEYDIYIKWKMTSGADFGDWIYKGSTFSNTWSVIDPGAKSFQISIQKVTYPKQYANKYSLYTSSEINL